MGDVSLRVLLFLPASGRAGLWPSGQALPLLSCRVSLLLLLLRGFCAFGITMSSIGRSFGVVLFNTPLSSASFSFSRGSSPPLLVVFGSTSMDVGLVVVAAAAAAEDAFGSSLYVTDPAFVCSIGGECPRFVIVFPLHFGFQSILLLLVTPSPSFTRLAL